MSLQPGQRLSHYRVIGEIGHGGMGAVYRATDTRLNREVAIKVLPAEVTADPDRRARFHQEARLAAAFSHPNIATVHDVGEEEGITFIVMEVVRGDSLRKLVTGEPPSIELAIAEGIAAGLARADRDGIVDRDLKPDNVVLSDEGRPKILDFGLGKSVPASTTESRRGGTPSRLSVAPQALEEPAHRLDEHLARVSAQDLEVVLAHRSAPIPPPEVSPRGNGDR